MTPPPPPSRRGSFAGYVALTPADIRWVRLCAVFTNDRVKPPVHRAAFQALRRENRESWRSVKVTVLVRDFQADNKPLEAGRCFPHNFSSNSNSSALAHISASPLKKKKNLTTPHLLTPQKSCLWFGKQAIWSEGGYSSKIWQRGKLRRTEKHKGLTANLCLWC